MITNCRSSLSNLCVFGALLFIVSAPGAYADLILTLDVGDTSITNCCGTGPFGTVDFQQINSSTVTGTVTLYSPYLFVDTGQAGAFAFNIAGVLFSNLNFVVSASSINAGFSSTVVGNGTFSEHMDGFGHFDYAIQGDANHTAGGSTPIGQLLSFTVSTIDNSDLPVSDFQISSIGGTPATVAADIFTPATNTGSGITGFVANDPSVPEARTAWLVGTGLLGLAWLMRRRSRALP